MFPKRSLRPKPLPALLLNCALAFITSFCFVTIFLIGSVPASLSSEASSAVFKILSDSPEGIKNFICSLRLFLFIPGICFLNVFCISFLVPFTKTALFKLVSFILEDFKRFPSTVVFVDCLLADPSPALSNNFVTLGLSTKLAVGLAPPTKPINPDTTLPGSLTIAVLLILNLAFSFSAVAFSAPPTFASKLALISLRKGAFSVAC